MVLLLLSLLVFLVVGIPIAYALGLSALFYFFIYQPDLLLVLPQRLFAGMDSYALIALPLFILMGAIMNESGITSRLINYCMLFVGRFRGGMGMVNVASSMLFGGISGSSTSDTASIGSILIPEMEKRGYPVEFAAGLTVASSTMGMIIPPSIPLVIYAVTAQVSVGRLFLGGIIPGLAVGVLQLGITIWLSRRNNYPKEDIEITPAILLKETFSSLYVFIMPLFIVGVVVFGVATATESAGLGALYALVIGFLITRQLSWKALLKAFNAGIGTSAKIMMIIAMSQLYIWVLALERVPQSVSAFMSGIDPGPIVIMLMFSAIVLIAGTFIDVSPAILLLTPVFLPPAVQAGVSPVVFGVVLVAGLAVGNCTPPVGNCLNVCALVCGQPIGKIFRGAIPFLCANILVLILIVLFPKLISWIPTLMMGQ